MVLIKTEHVVLRLTNHWSGTFVPHAARATQTPLNSSVRRRFSAIANLRQSSSKASVVGIFASVRFGGKYKRNCPGSSSVFVLPVWPYQLLAYVAVIGASKRVRPILAENSAPSPTRVHAFAIAAIQVILASFNLIAIPNRWLHQTIGPCNTVLFK